MLQRQRWGHVGWQLEVRLEMCCATSAMFPRIVRVQSESLSGLLLPVGGHVQLEYIEYEYCEITYISQGS